MSQNHAFLAVLIPSKVVECVSSPSGMTSNISNGLPRQHCLHVLVHAVFAGRQRICLELLAYLEEDLLVLLRPI